MRDAKPGLDANAALSNDSGELLPELPAGCQLVVGAAAERLLGVVAAQDPDDLGLGLRLLEPRQVDDGADRRMPGAQHGDRLAGVARALSPEHIGHAVGDALAALGLADRFEAVGSGRIGREPGARGVDHRIGTQRRWSLAVAVADLEGRRLPTRRLDLVEAGAGDGDDAGAGLDVPAERRPGRQRLEILLHQLCPGRIVVGIGAVPARLAQQPLRRLVDVVAPGREHAHMAPLPHGMADPVALLQHDRLEPALQRMRRRGQARRAGADDRYLPCRARAHSIHPSGFIELKRKTLMQRFQPVACSGRKRPRCSTRPPGNRATRA